jgi:hypothetical protein
LDRRYRLYGLTLSSPLSLPIPPASNASVPDVRFRPAAAHAFPRAARRPRDWFHYRAMPDGAAHLEWRGLFEFLVSPDGGTVRYRRLAGATDASLGTYLLGHVVSFSLVARGAEPLHGTAVAIGSDVVVFVGECGEGKSTLGAAMLSRGARIVSDDLIAVRRRGRDFFVAPGPARIKLYRRVARALVGARRESRMHRDTAKLVLPLRQGERTHRPARLRAIYVIDRPRRGRASGEIRIDPLSPGAAVVELVRASFNLVIDTPDRERRRFALASELARVVPVRRLTYPRSLAALPDVCDKILDDVRS